MVVAVVEAGAEVGAGVAVVEGAVGAGEAGDGGVLVVLAATVVVVVSLWPSSLSRNQTKPTPPAPRAAPTRTAAMVRPDRRGGGLRRAGAFFEGCRVATSAQSTGEAGSMAGVSNMRTLVEETIEVIRPALQADGGDIELKDVDESTGVVSVTLVGACGTCPASTQTLKAGIERIMRDRVDGVTEVVNV